MSTETVPMREKTEADNRIMSFKSRIQKADHSINICRDSCSSIFHWEQDLGFTAVFPHIDIFFKIDCNQTKYHR
uniref:Uncharacterized protein n=1 Tax=Arion vulgaris TaxID=1028688 RepID=A0A0B7B069_9EUPU